MIEIGGKPIIWHIIKLYANCGINDFVVCLGYKGYVIKEYFANYFLHTSDVTFDIAPGQTVAMVGPTGAGKSSIAKLVGRIYDPNEGSVRVDGVPLPAYEIGSYRKRLGIVPQDAFCFRGTVASNISYGKPEASREQVENAAKAVGAYETLLSVPGGFDGAVEEEGRNLTAAQRQMMALARAWLAGPDLLILDEATSTLDLALEQKVLDAIGPLGCTTIFITHRLAVAEHASKVVVIDQGRVVDEGTHDELIARGGAYTKLWHLGPDVEPDIASRAPELTAEAPRDRCEHDEGSDDDDAAAREPELQVPGGGHFFLRLFGSVILISSSFATAERRSRIPSTSRNKFQSPP